ncbi:MAG TPA: UvrD-helicase domain-containing protein [Chloroflexota bacterium]|nr:UvrD-helicase domain-containing protein [Chloroflexota bacterium]
MLDLSRLSEAQRQAATAPDGPLLVIAGPGSGKTTVLAARIAHLVLMRHVSPATILAVAFTRAAAAALRQRLTGMLRDQAQEVDVSTFHSLCLRIVRLWWEELGFAHDGLTVYTEAEQRTEIERLAMELKLPTGLDGEDLLRAVDRFRLDGESPGSPAVAEVARRYEALLRRRAVVDFTAMLALPLRLFAEREDALRVQQDAYRHVLADEFQDLSLSQYTLLRRLAEPHHNLALVGDPAQSLYRWLGAGRHVLEAFERDFPQRHTIRLDESYRSTERILAITNALGREVTGGRELHTDNPAGQAPLVFVASDEQDEARFVTTEIRRLLRESFTVDAIAVLYRTNLQAEPIGLAMRAAGIPCRVQARVDLEEICRDETAANDTPEDAGPAVTLATIHQSKGCEWRAVFVIGLEDGLLPNVRTLRQTEQDEALREEQRLAYVAVARARERLYLTYCRHRTIGGEALSRVPSRFLRNLPRGLLRPAA